MMVIAGTCVGCVPCTQKQSGSMMNTLVIRRISGKNVPKVVI